MLGGREGRHVWADLRHDGEGRAHPDGGDRGEVDAHHPAQRLRRRPVPGGPATGGATADLRCDAGGSGGVPGRIRRAAVWPESVWGPGFGVAITFQAEDRSPGHRSRCATSRGDDVPADNRMDAQRSGLKRCAVPLDVTKQVSNKITQRQVA